LYFVHTVTKVVGAVRFRAPLHPASAAGHFFDHYFLLI
jgi:hypothetical protein